jgi:hypothetical protein
MRLAAGVERYTQSNKSGGRAEPTKGDQQNGPRMSNILKRWLQFNWTKLTPRCLVPAFSGAD